MIAAICIYEDDKYRQFQPLTKLRPVYLLRSGIIPLYKRIRRFFPDTPLTLGAREQIAPLVTAEAPDYPVNIIKRPQQGDLLFLNGRVRDYGDLPRLVREARLSTIYKHQGETVALLLKADILTDLPHITTPDQYLQVFAREKEDIPDFDTSATLYQYPWELVADLDDEIGLDVEALRPENDSATAAVHSGAAVLGEEQVHLSDAVEIAPTAVIDAREGPVVIGANTKIGPHTAVIGPCYIGPNSLLVGGKIAGSSIGHTCRVGGEVEGSIFHAYVNKYHAGFIGHSYVCPWVNFGAMTTNSDLKNNYSTIRVTINDSPVDTGLIKVGSFIGDHTKFGIGTLLNTGISIGVCCNLFGGGLISDKAVPSFSWGHTGNYSQYQVEKAIETAMRTADRRNVTLSEAEIAALRDIAAGAENDTGVLRW